MTLTEIFDHHIYLVLLAHPDDEIYCSALLHRLILKQKEVHVLYATSGDAKGQGQIREAELRASMELIGVPTTNVHLLAIPEREILENVNKLVVKAGELISQHHIDCFIGHDYEGGHEAHDIVSFVATELVRIHQIDLHIVFPLYHGRPQERKAAQFKPSRKNFLEMMLEPEEKKLKEGILNIHKSQKGHFEGLKRSTHNYMDLLKRREVYHVVHEPISFRKKPMEVVGYEYHRNGFTFDDFQEALDEYEKAINIPS